MTALLFDESSHSHPNNAPIDFAKVKAAGYVGGWVKSTEGASYTNPYFAADYKAARAAGLVVGPYHWVSPGSSASDQVTNALTAIAPLYRPGDLYVALDFEQAGDTHALLHAVRDGLHARGYRTVTYTYPSFWADNGSPSCAECAAEPLWFASYSGTQPAAPAPWRHVDVWQYAGTSVAIPGMSGPQDSSRLLADIAEIRSPAPASHSAKGDDMKLIQVPGDASIYLMGVGTKWHVPDVATLSALKGVLSDPTVHVVPAVLRDALTTVYGH